MDSNIAMYPLIDIQCLYRIWLTELGQSPHEVERSSTEFIAAIQKEPDPFFAVAYDGPTLIGFMCSKIIDRPYGAEDSFAMIDHVYVLEGYRGAKVFKNLFSQTMAWATDKKLKAIHGMTPRPKTYERLGFKPIGTYLSMEIN